jgi:hypothetical protein
MRGSFPHSPRGTALIKDLQAYLVRSNQGTSSQKKRRLQEEFADFGSKIELRQRPPLN